MVANLSFVGLRRSLRGKWFKIFNLFFPGHKGPSKRRTFVLGSNSSFLFIAFNCQSLPLPSPGGDFVVDLLSDDPYDFKERQEQYKLNSTLMSSMSTALTAAKLLLVSPHSNSAVLQHNVTHNVIFRIPRSSQDVNRIHVKMALSLRNNVVLATSNTLDLFLSDLDEMKGRISCSREVNLIQSRVRKVIRSILLEVRRENPFFRTTLINCGSFYRPAN